MANFRNREIKKVLVIGVLVEQLGAWERISTTSCRYTEQTQKNVIQVCVKPESKLFLFQII